MHFLVWIDLGYLLLLWLLVHDLGRPNRQMNPRKILLQYQKKTNKTKQSEIAYILQVTKTPLVTIRMTKCYQEACLFLTLRFGIACPVE